MLGFAIVGCGMIARFHARALADVPDTRVVALVSRKAANAQSLATALGLSCDIYTDLAPVLKRPDVHIVIITTPSGAHLEPAVAAAEAGKHVVVEKPLEITTLEGRVSRECLKRPFPCPPDARLAATAWASPFVTPHWSRNR